jgi:hypothetical protein
VSDYRQNQDRTAKRCTIFDEFNSIADVSNMLTITTLEDCRGDGCTCTVDRTIINNVLTDFSGDASVKMYVSEDPTGEGLILTLTDNLVQPVTSAPQVHSNRIGCTERDEETGLLWYGRGYI